MLGVNTISSPTYRTVQTMVETVDSAVAKTSWTPTKIFASRRKSALVKYSGIVLIKWIFDLADNRLYQISDGH